MRILRFVLVALAALIAGGGWLAWSTWYGRPLQADWFFERVFMRQAVEQPELLTSMGMELPLGLDWYNGKLSDRSDEAAQRQLELAKAELATLKTYSPESLSPSQRLSAEILEYFIADMVAAEPFRFHNYPSNQIGGIQAELPQFMAQIHPVSNKKHAGQYVARLSEFGRAFDQTIAAIREREKRGIVPPKFILRRTIDQLTPMVAQKPKDSILYTSFAERLKAIKDLSDADRNALLSDAEKQIANTVIPAYGRLQRALQQQEAKATNDAGIWHTPNGDAAYRHFLKSSTTTDLTPEEVHQRGLQRVSELKVEMRARLDELGFAGKPIPEAIKALETDPRNQLGSKEAGIKYYTDVINEMIERAGGYFDKRPKAKVEVKPIPEEFAASAASNYSGPAMDGSRPGYFNLKTVGDGLRRSAAKTLAYHEAVPGHHFQIALQQELQGVPTFRKLGMFNAYVEGWALYSERLAKEMGEYEGDPLGDLGRIQDEMLRATRLVVDTGLHYKRWTREQAIEFMAEAGLGDQTSEVERYIVWPGQACGYMVGQMKILDLRERAKQKLGSKFSIKEFHNVVLEDGAVPLAILERKVDAWIARKGG